MKKNIHPKYYAEAEVSCVCGHHFKVGSTLPEIKVEVCSHRQPFFTGKQKLLDTARRVEKFEERSAKKSTTKTSKTIKHSNLKAKKAGQEIVDKNTKKK